MTSTPAAGHAGGTPSVAPATPALDQLFGSVWPERDVSARPRLVAAAVAVGLLGAVVLPFRDLGIGTFVVLVAVGSPALVTRWPRRTPYLLVSTALAVLLLSMLALRAAEWISALCVLAAFGVAVSALVDARSVSGLLASAFAVPLAGIRGLPWLGRSIRTASHLGHLWPALRTGAVSLLLVTVFGALFASADAVFASWLDVVVPDLTVDTLLLRLFVLLALGGLALAASYVALNRPRVEALAPAATAPVGRPFEWLVPVGLVLALYVGFVAAQATAMFGGHDYLRATTGLTYADYVHQGFGQMTVATLLTLGVVATAARKAPRATARDRLLLRAVLGPLCLLTLVVVASALFRMHVYEEAYGFTRLRLLVSVFEGWLGLVVLLVIAAGLRLDGRWLPRAAVLSAGAALLGLALLNPDGYIAGRNVDRYVETGKADWDYLAGLSADAVPALADLPADAAGCVFGAPEASHDDWLEWNLGRSRADGRSLDAGAGCPSR
jgi:two-component system sensor histidine kinase BaeS